MVCQSDRYEAQQYFRREGKDSERPLAWHDTDGMSDLATWYHHHVTVHETPVGLGSGTNGRTGRGHPLERGCPDEVPQAFRDTFHPNLSEFQSAREEQSDSPPEYTLDDSGDESDDFVGYDLTNFHYTTVSD